MISTGVGLQVYPNKARINPQNSWLLGASSQMSHTAVFCRNSGEERRVETGGGVR